MWINPLKIPNENMSVNLLSTRTKKVRILTSDKVVMAKAAANATMTGNLRHIPRSGCSPLLL